MGASTLVLVLKARSHPPGTWIQLQCNCLYYCIFILRMHSDNQELLSFPATYTSVSCPLLKLFKSQFFWHLPVTNPPFIFCVPWVIHIRYNSFANFEQHGIFSPHLLLADAPGYTCLCVHTVPEARGMYSEWVNRSLPPQYLLPVCISLVEYTIGAPG